MRADAERVLFVHAHPDDETITTGGTIAELAARGAHVTVLTCTRGEAGRVLDPDLVHLEGTPGLADVRASELHSALAELGEVEHRWLGSADARRAGLPERRYLDSGLGIGADAEAFGFEHPHSLCAAELGEVAADIATVMLELRPDVVVSYDERDERGHPDHARVHEATRRAADVLGVPFYALRDGLSDAASNASVTVRVQGELLERKRRALAAHRTQLRVEGERIVLAGGGTVPLGRRETYRRLRREEEPHTLGTTIGSSLLALGVGALVGLLGTMAHQFAPPWGIGLALLASTALLAGLRLVQRRRLVALAAAIGVVAAIAMLTLPGAGGSVLVPDNVLGYVWTFTPVLVAAIVLAWPRIRF